MNKLLDRPCAVNFDMPVEEYKKRLAEAEERVRKAEKENKMLKECLIRMTLGRYGVLDE